MTAAPGKRSTGRILGSTDVTSSAFGVKFSRVGRTKPDRASPIREAAGSTASPRSNRPPIPARPEETALTLSAGNELNVSGLAGTTGYSSPVFTFGLACATTGFDPAQLEVDVNSADAADDGPALSYTYESNGEWMLCTVSTRRPLRRQPPHPDRLAGLLPLDSTTSNSPVKNSENASIGFRECVSLVRILYI